MQIIFDTIQYISSFHTWYIIFTYLHFILTYLHFIHGTLSSYYCIIHNHYLIKTKQSIFISLFSLSSSSFFTSPPQKHSPPEHSPPLPLLVSTHQEKLGAESAPKLHGRAHFPPPIISVLVHRSSETIQKIFCHGHQPHSLSTS